MDHYTFFFMEYLKQGQHFTVKILALRNCFKFCYVKICEK